MDPIEPLPIEGSPIIATKSDSFLSVSNWVPFGLVLVLVVIGGTLFVRGRPSSFRLRFSRYGGRHQGGRR